MSDAGLGPHLVETATKVITTINADGDVDYNSTQSSPCLYRDISTLNQVQNRNEVTIDGFLWFGPTENVQRGDVYYHPSEGYLRVNRVTRAKRLVADNATMFIKCEVMRQRQVS